MKDKIQESLLLEKENIRIEIKALNEQKKHAEIETRVQFKYKSSF